ncbi:hypothetical protein SteCoe_9977 [Stentor coeruleus]|uniref:Casein kinase I n=1 Tax=Stentor coeruleus TaxID=5963 RepID=A0A1R2CGK6_9CILI|nr:hypothetical protein SteCoe_9977 [Stentor coeruleus]
MEPKHIIIDNKYKISKKLGRGSFADVYKAFDIVKKEHVAIKFETISNHQQFLNEIQALSSLSLIEGVPSIISSGQYNNKQYIALELLDKSLDDKLKKYNKAFSLNCVTLIGLQIIKRLQNIHDMNYLHRDIKPSNIMIGRKKKAKNSILYLIDFGLSKKYRDPFTKQHSLYGENRQIIGNLKFSSLNTHLGIEQSRRDDIEACFNVLINCLKGSLPWDCSNQEFSNFLVLGIMKKVTIEQLCKDCPNEFIEIFKYIRALHFQDNPDYEYIIELLHKIRINNKLTLIFDWIPKEKRRVSNDHLAVSSMIHLQNNVRRSSAQITMNSIKKLTKSPKHNNEKSSHKDSDSSYYASVSSNTNSASQLSSSNGEKDLLASEEEEEEEKKNKHLVDKHKKKSSGVSDTNSDLEEIKSSNGVTEKKMQIYIEAFTKSIETKIICRKDTLKDSSYPEIHNRSLFSHFDQQIEDNFS